LSFRTDTVLAVGTTGYQKPTIRIGLHAYYCIMFFKGSMSTEHAQMDYCSFAVTIENHSMCWS